MTVIAYRDGVLAADSMVTWNGCDFGRTTKIARAKDGSMGGACGEATYLDAFLCWVRGDREKPPEAADRNVGSGLLIHPCGKIEIFDFGGSFVMTAPYIAIGSGRPEAMGAMFAGADAVTAVKAAIALDTSCGGEITVLKLGEG